MDWTSLLPLLGVVVGSGLTSFTQRRNNAASQLLTSRISAYAACSDALHAYRKANLDRVAARNAHGGEDADPRQKVYDVRAELHGSINRVALLAEDQGIPNAARAAKEAIDDLVQHQGRAAVSAQTEVARRLIDEFVSRASKEVRT